MFRKQNFAITFFFLLSVVPIVDTRCPNNTHSIPSDIGSKWPCAYFEKDIYLFAESENICLQKNGHLITVHNAKMNKFIAGKITSLILYLW